MSKSFVTHHLWNPPNPPGKGTAWNQNLEYEFLAVDIGQEDDNDDDDDDDLKSAFVTKIVNFDKSLKK